MLRPARPVLGICLPARRSGRQSRCVVRAGIDQLPHLASSALHAAGSLPSTLSSAAAHVAPALLALADVDAGAAADAAAAAGEAVAKDDGGVFGFLATGFEAFLKVLDGGLEKLNVPYSYGFAIILLTCMVKAVTYPLSKQQVESTLSMQALQPRVKDLQARYKNDPERLQLETARLYKEAGVNPLAGCLPTLATIPVWIGLYKALSNVADEGLLTEGFFWIPSLGGPTTLTAQQAGGGLSWLLPFVDGAPPVGWVDAAAYLVLPVLLVASQYISQQVLSPPQAKDDPAQAQAQAILKFLPVMIGWFSLNVPSGLTLYWFTNNVLTTAQQLWLRKTTPPPAAVGASSGSQTVVKPQVIDVEVAKPSGKDTNARRSPKAEPAAAEAAPAPAASGGGKKKGEKFRKIKARETARKAAKMAEAGGSGSAAPAATATDVKVPDAPPPKDNGTPPQG